MTVYFEDLDEGDVLEFGTYDVTEDEIVEFAERYDPQWFHTQPERAREESHFDDLAASGWHTCAIAMRLVVDGHYVDAAGLGALGIEQLRWPNPTVPGDSLSVTVEILEMRRSESDPTRGLVTLNHTVTNQASEVKLEMRPTVMYACRNSG
ncbi:MaoC family dehydratase [Halobacterium noricense]|uniref:MaoC family dehydratase n=1 Tax=Halobacterium noricense TaxID=223182 RepID=UPI001E302954|nr:MaoC family dehydratase [Halobacterium noricense]UHH26769.1 MaoC family dehydratase [Halobacterium noricense]